MNHKEKLLEIYSQCIDDQVDSNFSYEQPLSDHLLVIKNNLEKQKGVFTVLLTLGIHKLLFPSQDIRYHQDNMANGFSGRSVDTKYITPTLKELELPSMSESGWLTRSLEQPYPYTKDYNGKVGKPEVKKSFLEIVEHINFGDKTLDIVTFIINQLIDLREKNKVDINPISNPDLITIESFMDVLKKFMNETYTISGGSKIPVIAFYSIYEVLMHELKRFEGCELKPLGYHTTCDQTSKSSGDIEIFKNNQLFESLEIKYNIEIGSHIVNRAIEKIHKFNPSRYYILSTTGIKQDDYDEVVTKIHNLKSTHGCQLIVNGLIPSLKYYLRLIEDPSMVVTRFTKILLNDNELKVEHKTKWKTLHEKNF